MLDVDGELPRHEVIVRDRVGGEMRQVSEREGVQRLVARLLADLEPDVPRVAVAARGGVLLRDARVGRDRPVQEVVREGREQLGDARREAGCSDRSTASPRKTCVPGVHANAGVGINATIASAIAT